MERQWKLGKDVHLLDSLFDGFTFDDVIVALQCGEPIIDEDAVWKIVRSIVASQLQDMESLLQNNMREIIAAAMAGRDKQGEIAVFTTKDGFSVGLEDEVYVVFTTQKPDKKGKIRSSRKETDVSIYRLRVFGMHKELYLDRDSKKSIITYLDGIAWREDDILPGKNPLEMGIPTFRVCATPINTFVTKESADAALKEFKTRGLTSICNTIFFSDEWRAANC